MAEQALYLPLLLLPAGALAALLFGLTGLRKRLSITHLSWALTLLPLAAFAWYLARVPALNDGATITWQMAWLPALGLNVGLFLDGLSGLFALLVTGIGALVVLYSGSYFKGDQGAWRFLAYILLFMTSMLGLVTAGDVLTLFIFWEGTSITSYLLVAYKYKDETARRGAFKALFITGGGGIALLAGLLFVSHVAGSTDLATILGSGDVLRASPLYPVMLGLVAFGALTKSAQVPAHIWLPDAMSAPTPASAYLHSATMVKAGIYLMARMNPALGQTEAWFWLLSSVGLVTMLTGAYLGVKQNDLKALLAYSTISQLGVLMLLIGQDTDVAFKALVVGVVAHALYKSALFLLVGIVDHETGTRDWQRLGGLRRAMPATFALTAIAGLSLAGLPPLFGFLAKETLLATAVHPSLPEAVAWIFPAGTVIAGALLLVQAGIIVVDVFLGSARDETVRGHEAPWPMLLAPAGPALFSLALGILPEPEAVAQLLATAAKAAYGAPVKVSLALWTGLNVPLLLSAVAISVGGLLFVNRRRVRAWQRRVPESWSFDAVYAGALRLIDGGAFWATRLQVGKLRLYLFAILAGTVALVVGAGGLTLPDTITLTWPQLDPAGEIAILRLFALVVAAGAAVASVVLRRDLFAILALGASGLSIAVLMVLEPAPDVALVQVVVDILAVVILVLALTRLPRPERRRASLFTFAQRPAGLVRDGIVAAAAGLVVAAITFNALLSQPRPSAVTPFYEANAKLLAGATDIVGAIIVDFRALDTLVEIAVFSVAGLGIYTLLRHAARTFGDTGAQVEELPPPAADLPTQGIGGAETSSFIHALAYVALPLALVIAVVHVLYGHDRPGDGFTAGVIVSLAVGFWYVVFGYEGTRRRLRWLRPTPLIGGGLLLAVGTGVLAALWEGRFLARVDFGALWGLPLPQGISLSTSLLFEVAIFLAVLGSMVAILNTLGHPERPVTSHQ